jgi:hypothetical protein
LRCSFRWCVCGSSQCLGQRSLAKCGRLSIRVLWSVPFLAGNAFWRHSGWVRTLQVRLLDVDARLTMSGIAATTSLTAHPLRLMDVCICSNSNWNVYSGLHKSNPIKLNSHEDEFLIRNASLDLCNLCYYPS